MVSIEDVLKAIELVDRRLERHDSKTERLGEGIKEALSRAEREDEKRRDALERLESSVDRLCQSLDKAQKGLDPQRLIMWLVAAIILSSMGSEGLAILAKVLGLP